MQELLPSECTQKTMGHIHLGDDQLRKVLDTVVPVQCSSCQSSMYLNVYRPCVHGWRAMIKVKNTDKVKQISAWESPFVFQYQLLKPQYPLFWKSLWHSQTSVYLGSLLSILHDSEELSISSPKYILNIQAISKHPGATSFLVNKLHWPKL